MRKAEACIKARSPPASLAVRGRVTEHTTVKWPINPKNIPCFLKINDHVPLLLQAPGRLSLYCMTMLQDVEFKREFCCADNDLSLRPTYRGMFKTRNGELALWLA